MATYSFCNPDIPKPIIYKKCDSDCTTSCLYDNITNITPPRDIWSNENGKTIFLSAGKYPIRILRNNFNDINKTDFSFITNSKLFSYISKTKKYVFNSLNNNYEYIPNTSCSGLELNNDEYSSKSILNTNYLSVNKQLNNYGCDQGDYATSIKIDDNNNMIDVNCANGKKIQNPKYKNYNDCIENDGLILKIYQNTFDDYFNNPTKLLLFQKLNGITDLSNMTKAINGLIKNNYDNYIYEWTGFIKILTDGNYNFYLKCQNNEDNAYFWIDDNAKKQTQTNYLINDNIKTIQHIDQIITTTKIDKGCTREPKCNSFEKPIVVGGNINQITLNGNNYTVVSFKSTTSQNTFTLNGLTYCDILVVGGGGGGGGDIGGGGGGGQVIYTPNVQLGAGTYTITIGSGGSGSSATDTNTNNFKNGENGNSSSISFNGSTTINGKSYIALGGGGGGNYNNNQATAGNNGGNGGGGGGSAINSGSNASGGFGLNNGNNGAGGQLYNNSLISGGGGGGANLISGTAIGKDGGNGIPIDIIGSYIFYGAGGGGGIVCNNLPPNSINIKGEGIGGSNEIGGNGNSSYFITVKSSVGNKTINHNGKMNTGSGGGGGAYNYPPLTNNDGGSGSDGIVIIRYINIQTGIEPKLPISSSVPNINKGNEKVPNGIPSYGTLLEKNISIKNSLNLPTYTLRKIIVTNIIAIKISKNTPNMLICNFEDINLKNKNIDSTITFNQKTTCDILVVGGGGGGGQNNGGGGGGGQVIIDTITFEIGTYNITVGIGGKGSITPSLNGNNGNNSYIKGNNINIIAGGGGGGGSSNNNGNNGLLGTNGSGSDGGSSSIGGDGAGSKANNSVNGGNGIMSIIGDDHQYYGVGGGGAGKTLGVGGNNYSNVATKCGIKINTTYQFSGYGAGGGGTLEKISSCSNSYTNSGNNGRVIIRFNKSSYF